MKNESHFPNQIYNSNLTLISDSATEIKVTYAAIYRYLDIMNELNIEFIFLEVDQQFKRRFMLCLRWRQQDLKYSMS